MVVSQMTKLAVSHFIQPSYSGMQVGQVQIILEGFRVKGSG